MNGHSKTQRLSAPRTLELRRIGAIRMICAGASQADAAHLLGVSREAVRKWWDRYCEGGVRALRARPHLGPPRRVPLSVLKRRLPPLLSRGAASHGFLDGIWTLSRVVGVIEREFGVRYSVGYTWRLLVEQLGWRCEAPEWHAPRRSSVRIRAIPKEPLASA
jgi:transposase